MLDIEAHDDTPAAPGDIETLQRFLNLHDHRAGSEADVPPPPEMVRAFMVRRGLLPADSPYAEEEHAHAMELYSAIHDRLRAGEVAQDASASVRAIDEAASRARFRLRFGEAEPALEPTAGGVDGALGSLVGLLFLAELDGRWAHMKECASQTCTAVFFDRSKNRSGKWCSMRSCGNKHKVRTWRERHRSDDVDA